MDYIEQKGKGIIKLGRPRKGDNLKVQLNVSIDEDVRLFLQQKSDEEIISVSAIVNKSLKDYFLIG